MLWITILFVALALLILGMIYMTWAVGKFSLIQKASKGKKARRRLFSFGIVALVFALFTVTLSLVNAVIILLHLVIFRILYGLIFAIIKKVRKKDYKVYWQAWFALVTCIIYLAVGFYLCKHVWVTRYELSTAKDLGGLRVAMFADSHLGTTFGGEKLGEYLEDMMAESPDIIVIPGAMIDDGTSRADMIECCRVLGSVKPKYGVWFAYGNHDRGYYRDEDSSFSNEEFVSEMEKNGVHILCDEVELIDDRFYLIGREDRYNSSRMSIGDLTKDLDQSKYMLVLDHQPNDYDNEAAAKADLVLSGHTHGGQMLPVTFLGEYIGANDRTYGYERKQDTDFIVTSGISDWDILFKTGTKSEYVIIDIK